MKSLTNLREAIIVAHNRGKKQTEIADFFGISQGAVSKAIKRFEETGSNQDRPKGRPEKTARNRRNIMRAREMIQRNPTTKANSHPNVESLKKALTKAWNEITLDTLVKIVDNFPKRLKKCIDSNGGYFE
uniref:Insertion element IS150 protein InsJ-like helix-turn-helix domain-containing protein n=1 Tax=Acrobeloides nanus TaxID=290746 RepID=A0A914E153_9BILA